jgi:hypothetical protein
MTLATGRRVLSRIGCRWRWKPREILRRVVSWKLTDVSEVLTANQSDPIDDCSKHLWNVGQLPLDYMAQYARRLSPSYSPPWEPEISIVVCGSTVTGVSIARADVEFAIVFLWLPDVILHNPFCGVLLVKIFSASYGTRSFSTMFTKAR